MRSASIKHSVDGLRVVRLLYAVSIVCKPRSLSMFGNIFTMSNDTKIVSSGNSLKFILSIISSKCAESLILDFIFDANGADIASREEVFNSCVTSGCKKMYWCIWFVCFV